MNRLPNKKREEESHPSDDYPPNSGDETDYCEFEETPDVIVHSRSLLYSPKAMLSRGLLLFHNVRPPSFTVDEAH
jgi:hypothetical protein